MPTSDANAPAPRRPARAETVGSLLRPPALRAAIDRVYEPGHRAILAEERRKDRSELHRAEDEAIDEAVRRQVDLGLDVISDGEFRRYMFLNSFFDAVEGFTTDRNPVEFRNADGETVTWHVHQVEERLRQVDSPAAREAAYLKRTSGGYPYKVTFPAASIFAHPFTFKAGITDRAYRDLDELVDDMIGIERCLIADAVQAGARYVQMDFPLYPYLSDPGWRGRFVEAGFDLDRVLHGAIEADNRVIEGIPPHVTVGLHICRGNYRSKWLCEGSLEPVAERIFNELRHDVFLVEWDDIGRDGGYETIRHVPPGKIMVMGVVSTKTPEIEPDDEILRRMDQAAGFLALDQLAVSAQCGFASVMEGNDTTEEIQWRKLELVARVADRLWGRA